MSGSDDELHASPRGRSSNTESAREASGRLSTRDIVGGGGRGRGGGRGKGLGEGERILEMTGGKRENARVEVGGEEWVQKGERTADDPMGRE